MIKKIILAASVICLAACGNRQKAEMTILDGFAQGTTFHIAVKDTIRHDIAGAVDSIFTEVDNSMSVFNKESLISKINRNQTDSLNQYMIDCINIARYVSRESGGMYDITVKTLTSAYGFTGDDTVKNVNVDSLLQFVGYEKISIRDGRLVKRNPNIQIDLNSIAKGYTVDLIAAYFDKCGFTDYLIEVGGEIFARGTNAKGKKWVVGIDKPIDGNNQPGQQLQISLSLTDKGLATSGNYRKYYVDSQGNKIVHTINPKTGKPVVSNLLSATVVAKNTALADAYSTLFMVIGTEKTIEFLSSHKDIDAYLIYSGPGGEFKTYVTKGLNLNL